MIDKPSSHASAAEASSIRTREYSMNLKARLAKGDRVVGTFVKTPSPIVFEVLARTALDCLVLDAEHAPFDRMAIDACIMAAVAAGKDVLVRVPTGSPEHVLNALDCGATGVLVPHVRSADNARAVVRCAHYGHGGRGYAGSSRAAGYTQKPVSEHLQASAARTVVILQIEDPEGVEAIDEIAAVEGVDALFVGRVDLMVSLGASTVDTPEVVAAGRAVCHAGRKRGLSTGLFLGAPNEIPAWADLGASFFLLGSDHTFLLSGAKALAAAAGEAAA